MKTLAAIVLLFACNAFAAKIQHNVYVGFYDPTIRFDKDSGEALSKKDILQLALEKSQLLDLVTHVEFSESIENVIVISVNHVGYSAYDGSRYVQRKDYTIQFDSAHLAKAFFKMMLRGEAKSIAIATNFSDDRSGDDLYYTDSKSFIVGYDVK